MTSTPQARTAAVPARDAPLPPGPGLPMALQTVLLATRTQSWMPKLRERYGDVFALNTFPERRVVGVSAPEDIRTVFSGAASTYHAGEGNMVLKPVMGEHSVLTSDEEDHRRVRKLLMPPFHGAALRGYRDMVTGLAGAEAARWPVGTPFASHSRMHALTLEIILRVVFGVSEGARLDELRTSLRRLVAVSLSDLFGWHVPAMQRFGTWRRNAVLKRRIDELLYAEIAERRMADDLDQRGDVLSRLLAVSGDSSVDGDSLSDEETRDQLVTLLLAGHETTATALAWTFHELARRPEQQAEAARAAAEGDAEYLEAVVKEALRLRPVIYMVARKLTADIELGGYRIPAGYTVMPMIGVAHADAARWDAPEEFRPERFAETNPPSTSWLPFGGGIRRCLGAGFSLMEATAVLQEVLSRYALTPERSRPEQARPRHVTLVPSRGARILARQR